MVRAWWLSLVCLLAAACGGGPPSAPTQTDASQPSQVSNRAPGVTLAFQGGSSCVPIPPLDGMPGRPCGLPVTAQASDPDGDGLTYRWTGCTDYGFPPNQSTCYVRQVGPVTATVEVNDGHGHTVTASVAGQGVEPPPNAVNHPPTIGFGYFSPIKVPPDSPTLEGLGSIGDPDEGDLCGGGGGVGGCPWLKAVNVSGDCLPDKYAVLGCYCLGGLTVDVYRTKPSGNCTLTLAVRDSWGLTTTAAFGVSYDQTGGPFKPVTLPPPGFAASARLR